MDWDEFQQNRLALRRLHVDFLSDQSNQAPQPSSITYDLTNVRVNTLATHIQPEGANHSYNGVMFTIKAQGFEDVELLSFIIGGQLGHIRIYKTDGNWKGMESDPSAWTLIANEKVKERRWIRQSAISRYSRQPETTDSPQDGQSWVEPYEVKLITPVRMSPGTFKGFYIHVESDHDRGLLYHSYKGAEVVKDKNLVILSGQGHTSNFPFDESGGWWRPERGLAGSVVYRSIRKSWEYKIHGTFPEIFKKVIVTLLLCKSRGNECELFGAMPIELLWTIFDWLDWKWWEDKEEKPEENEEVAVFNTNPAYDSSSSWGIWWDN